MKPQMQSAEEFAASCCWDASRDVHKNYDAMVAAVRERDAQVRASVYTRLADEEHAVCWHALFESRPDWGNAAVREAAWNLMLDCQRRESDYRQRAAKESKT